MKKILLNIAVMILPVLAVSSCVSSVDDVFDKSATERVEERIEEIKAELVSSENGWALPYFFLPGQFGGYSFVFKFYQDGTVDICVEESFSGDITFVTNSDYSVKWAEGPEIVFETYTDLLHFFADPQDDGQGYLGDFEFKVMELEAGKLKLKGVRHGIYQHMVKLTGTMDSDEYLTGVANIQDKLADFDIPALDVKGTVIALSSSGDGRVMSFSVKDGSASKDYQCSFGYTNEGITFYEPFEVKGISIQNFKYDDNNNQFVCTDPGASNVVIGNASHPALPLYQAQWWFKNGDMGAGFLTEWDAAKTSLYNTNANNEYIYYAAFGLDDDGVVSFYFEVGAATPEYTGSWNFSMQPEIGTNKVTLKYTSDSGSNGAWYHTNIPGFFTPITNALGGSAGKEFEISVADDGTWVKLVDTSDDTNWFTLHSTEQLLHP